MDVRILGPLQAGSPPVPLGGGKQRALLAVLALNAGRTVARRRLIDDLWGEAAPDTAVKMVQIHVSHLRRALPAGMITTRSPGYSLDVDPAAVDLHAAERMLDDGRAALASGDATGAAATLRAALALWRGPALAEFDEPFAVVESERIASLRITLQEQRIDADMALGRHADVVDELAALVARHPLRERSRGRLMLALYRCGRQAEALDVFRAGRHALGDQLGLEPSPELRDLERRILVQDPALDPPPPPDLAGGRPIPLRRAAPPAAPAPPVRYARSGDLSIAFEVTGAGPPDLVLVPGFVSHLTLDRAEPRHAGFLDGLSGFARLIRFDKRGTGLSDRPPGVPDLETRMDDVRAVMDAAGSERAVLLGYSEGGPLALLVAAALPERVAGLVLVGAYAKRVGPDEGYPWANPRKEWDRSIESLGRDDGYEAMLRTMSPSADPALVRWWGERCRAAASPGAVRALMEMNALIDVRDVLPAIRVPTLVVHRAADPRVVVGHGRYLAERIPGASYVELPGADHFVAVGSDEIVGVVEPWVRALPGAGPAGPQDGVLATILAVAPPAGGGARAAAAVAEEVAAHRGRATADPAVALFDGPTRAIRCGLAIAGRPECADVAVGLHTGEVAGDGGPAVAVARAVAASTAPGDVSVTATTRDLVPGSGLAFSPAPPVPGLPGRAVARPA